MNGEAPLPRARSLTLLQLNDLHGYLEPHAEIIRRDGADVFADMGGLARIASAFAEARADAAGAVVTLDNGDTFHGTYAAVKSRGEAMVPAMNALGFDAMTAHWEFAYGPAGFKDLTTRLTYPMLAINCYVAGSDDLFFEPCRVIEREGVRVGVIGIASNIVDKTMPPAFSEGVRFTLGRDELPGWVERLRRERVDVVVVLSHLGFPQDIKLAREVDGIDVIVSGHTHNRMEEPVIENGAIIFQSGCHGSFIGRLDLELADGGVVSHRHRLIPIDERFDADPEVAALVDSALAPHRDYLGQRVGEIGVGLHRYRMLQAPMDDLLLDAIAAAAGTQIAFSNGWRYGAPVRPGPVTMNDLWNIVPVDPRSRSSKSAAPRSGRCWRRTSSAPSPCDAYDQMGGYVKRCRGLKAYVKIENPAGRRIDRLFIEGRPFDAGQIYRAAFITEQGVPKKFGRNRRKLGIHAVEALCRHLGRQPVTAIEPRETVIAV